MPVPCRRRLVATGAVVAALVLTGCGRHADPALQHLRADPVMSMRVTGMTQYGLYGQGAVTSLGARHPATLTRLMSTGRRDADTELPVVSDEDVAKAAAAARAAGWPVEPDPSPFATWSGVRRVDGIRTRLVVSRNDSPTLGSFVDLRLTQLL